MKKVIIKVLIMILVILISFGLILVGTGFSMYHAAIKEQPLSEKVEQIRQKENYTKLDEMPEIYKKAVIAVEDHRFYNHDGIDIIAIGRAIFNDIKALSFVEGGSTITQQLAKNTYFTQEKELTRKIAEVFMAFTIEDNYNKDEILELYLNTSYFGDGYDTPKEAAKGYFNKDISELSDYEETMLAGIPNAPSVYAPTQNLNLAKQRQKQVLDKMIKYDYITKEEADKIVIEGSKEYEEYSYLNELRLNLYF